MQKAGRGRAIAARFGQADNTVGTTSGLRRAYETWARIAESAAEIALVLRRRKLDDTRTHTAMQRAGSRSRASREPITYRSDHASR